MTVCLNIENQLVDVIVNLNFTEIQKYPVHVFKISARLQINVFLQLKKAFCDVFM